MAIEERKRGGGLGQGEEEDNSIHYKTYSIPLNLSKEPTST